MHEKEFIGLAISLVVLLAGSIKLEMIKSIVGRITDATGKENIILSVVVLLIAAILPAAIGYSLPEKEAEPVKPKEAVAPKGKEQAIADATLEGADFLVNVGYEAAEQIAAEKERKIKEFERTREQKWVFMIGDWMDKGNSKALETAFSAIENHESVYILRIGKRCHFFRDDNLSKVDADASLETVQNEIGGLKVVVKDIIENCDFKNPNIVGDRKDMTIGKRKKKVSIPCYTIGSI